MAYYGKSGRKCNKHNDNKRHDDSVKFIKRYAEGKNAKPTFNGFDATTYKKPDIMIKDLNGKIYKVSGNFSTAFSADILKTQKRVEEIRQGSDKIEQFPQMFDLLKEWCLSLINLNVDGEQFTMEDVNKGFNDIYVLYNLVAYISNIIGQDKKKAE